MSDDYLFPCVIVRSLETDLMNTEDLVRLMDQKSMAGVMSILMEHGYGDGKEPDDPREIEKILSRNLEKTYKDVLSAVPNEKELNFLKYPTDYHNAKVLLKAEFLKINASHLLVDAGSIPGDQMEEMIRRRDYTQMSLPMREALTEAVDLFSKTGDPQEIDIRLDAACYKDMLTDAEDGGNEFLIEYVRKQIDFTNINTFLRLREIGKPKTFFKKVFLEGGNLDMQGVEMKTGEILQETTMSSLEKYLDNQKMDYVRDALYIPFGIEPIVGFLQAKEAEVKNLRMILSGRIAGMDDSAIRERLRDTYV